MLFLTITAFIVAMFCFFVILWLCLECKTIKELFKDWLLWLCLVWGTILMIISIDCYHDFLVTVQTEAIDCYNTGNYQYVEKIVEGVVVDHYYKIYPPDYD